MENGSQIYILQKFTYLFAFSSFLDLDKLPPFLSLSPNYPQVNESEENDSDINGKREMVSQKPQESFNKLQLYKNSSIFFHFLPPLI